MVFKGIHLLYSPVDERSLRKALLTSRQLAKVNAERTQDSGVKMRELGLITPGN